MHRQHWLSSDCRTIAPRRWECPSPCQLSAERVDGKGVLPTVLYCTVLYISSDCMAALLTHHRPNQWPWHGIADTSESEGGGKGKRQTQGSTIANASDAPTTRHSRLPGRASQCDTSFLCLATERSRLRNSWRVGPLAAPQ